MGAVVIGPVDVALSVVCDLADSAGVTMGAGVCTVTAVVGWLLVLLGTSVDAPQSAAKLTRIAATVLRRTAAMIGKLARPFGGARLERPEPVFARRWRVDRRGSIAAGGEGSQWVSRRADEAPRRAQVPEFCDLTAKR